MLNWRKVAAAVAVAVVVSAGAGAVFANAQGKIAFYETAETVGPQIRLGEVAELQGFTEPERRRLSGVALGSAAQPGGELEITRAAMRTRLYGGGVDPHLYDVALPERLVVRTLQTLATGQRLMDGAVEYLNERLPWDREKAAVVAKSLPRDISLNFGTLDVRYSTAGDLKKFGPIRLYAQLYLDGRKKRTVNLGEHVGVLVSVLEAARNIDRGEALSRDAVRMVERDVTDLDGYPIDDPEQAIGHTAARQIVEGETLTTRKIKLTPAVSSGEAVRLIVRNGGIKIETKAKALGQAYLGETVRVQMDTPDRKVLEAEVAGYGTVEITKD